ncbi:MAG TPA: sterol desaturase family protein [Myxococcota bacterium]|nr:sterol desaturase family protein [Myxococcota bacterium]
MGEAAAAETFFRLGQGRISGFLSVSFGALSVGTVLCFLFPSWLTTPELRKVYDPEEIRLLLRAGICVSLAFGALTFVLNRKKKLGAIGILLTFAALSLGGWNVRGAPVPQRELSLGLDWLVLDFLVSVALFTFIEKVVPQYEAQPILRAEWQLDLVYFGLNHLLISVVLLVVNGFAPLAFGWATNARVQAAICALPVPAQVALLVLAADFAQYWTHRTFHEVPWLWKFHAIHHSAETMDWLAGSRMHLVDELATRALVMVPLYLLGPAKAALDAYVLFAAVQAVLLHANVGLRFGPLKYVLSTPQYHHWHHSSEASAIDTNYAAHVPLWDRLFGTYHMPVHEWPHRYGTTKPLPRTFVGQLLHPFLSS